MSDFKAKMHQIWFRLGLCPRPRWGSLQRSPRPPSCDALLLRGRVGRRGEEEREEEGAEGEREKGAIGCTPLPPPAKNPAGAPAPCCKTVGFYIWYLLSSCCAQMHVHCPSSSVGLLAIYISAVVHCLWATSMTWDLWISKKQYCIRCVQL